MTSTRTTICAFLASLAMATVVSAQTAKVINVTEGRPLDSALHTLEVAVGMPINYEDPPYENLADVQDVSTPQQRAARPGYQNLVPRSGQVTAQMQMPLVGGPTVGDAASGANLLLVSYRQNMLPGDFKLEQANGMLYVTPAKILSASGTMRDVTSPMATVISVPFAKRSVSDTAQAILDAVNKATGLNIVIGTFPFWPTDTISFSATGEPARDALARLFAQTGKGGFSYSLLFDPKPDTMRIFDYMINVRPAGYVAPMPGGVGPMTRAMLVRNVVEACR